MEPDLETVNESMEAIRNGRTQPIEEKIKVRWWKRWRERRAFKKMEKKNITSVDIEGQNGMFTAVYGKKERKGILGRLFDPVRIEKRRKFRVEVSANRKYIMIGVAVVAVCITIIYLSVTYGGSFSGVLKFLGMFK